MISVAHAQEAASAAAQTTAAQPQQSPIMSFVPFILIFLVFYFLMIRPQKKKLEEEKQLLSNLNKGDEIYTKSGVFGTIAGLTDKVVTLEVSDGIKIKFLRSQVAGFAKNIFSNESK